MRTRARRAAAALLPLLLAGCSAGTDRAAVGAGPLPPLDVETGVVHVHGLGVDPGDGTLYAATHSGLFKIPEQGDAERVANRAQDTMGFSVVGPGRFIGSGHPDFREDDVRPPLLGLIESDDAGVTWDRISLHGAADFHALAAAHGQVYGYDSTSGTFMVTEDKKEWDRRSRLQLLAFAVDPADPEKVVATTPQGPQLSVDGGRTWTSLAGAPSLAVVAWQQGAGLFGVAGDGTVHRSGDGGASWQRSGSAGGEPEALAVDAVAGKPRLHVAVAGRGIVVSGDGGRTFTTRYAEAGG
ncbi:MAG: exo-alpha-sialidase [Mycobacteriales bacterium]|nr:exo-alpha-sialidase [Mycobacteriales bacterium]